MISSFNHDKNLLFGVFSHQLGFVSRDQLMTALSRWAATSNREDQQPISEIMQAYGWTKAEEVELIESFVQMHLEGRDPTDSNWPVGLTEDSDDSFDTIAPWTSDEDNSLPTPRPDDGPRPIQNCSSFSERRLRSGFRGS